MVVSLVKGLRVYCLVGSNAYSSSHLGSLYVWRCSGFRRTFSSSHILLHKYFLLCRCLRKSVVFMLVSSQIRSACPCSGNKTCLPRGSDRSYRGRESSYPVAIIISVISVLRAYSVLK